MKNILHILMLVSTLIIITRSYPVDASEALCKESLSSTPYCKYVGKIDKLYLNEEGLLLIFLEDAIPLNQASKFGYDINSGKAIAMQLYPENTTLFTVMHASLLKAMTENLVVEIHTRDVTKGYLKLDRMWTYSPSGFF